MSGAGHPSDPTLREAAARAREVCAREVARHRAETAALRREHAEFRRTSAVRGPEAGGRSRTAPGDAGGPGPAPTRP